MDDYLMIGDGAGHRMIAAPTGAGKSYTVGAAVEELYARHIPFILLDTKTINHIGLIQLPDVKLLKISPRLDYNNLEALLDIPYILCVPASKTIPIQEIIAVYRQIVNYIWLHQNHGRIIIVEEAHNWCKNASVPDPLLEQIAREGRSSKIFVWFVTQRLQNFSQLLWSQCTYTYLWHFVIPTDVKYVGQMVPDFEKINREELMRHDVLIWDMNEYTIVKANQVKRITQHKG